MVRITGIVIILRMAARTGVGCVIVVAVVAFSAVIGNGRVCAVQRVKIVVVRECRRLPASGGMAGGTIHGKPERCMIRISRSIIAVGMTGSTLRWCTRVTI